MQVPKTGSRGLNYVVDIYTTILHQMTKFISYSEEINISLLVVLFLPHFQILCTSPKTRQKKKSNTMCHDIIKRNSIKEYELWAAEKSRLKNQVAKQAHNSTNNMTILSIHGNQLMTS